MYTFKYEDDDIVVEMKTKKTDVYLNDIVDTFESFLRAAGFSWINDIKHVEKEDPPAKDYSQTTQMNIDFPPPISARGLEQE